MRKRLPRLAATCLSASKRRVHRGCASSNDRYQFSPATALALKEFGLQPLQWLARITAGQFASKPLILL